MRPVDPFPRPTGLLIALAAACALATLSTVVAFVQLDAASRSRAEAAAMRELAESERQKAVAAQETALAAERAARAAADAERKAMETALKELANVRRSEKP